MEKNEVVTFNVGGEIFQTTKTTIITSGYLTNLISSGFSESSANNAIFIDRDPHNFRHILSLLRDSNHPFPRDILYELEFYGINIGNALLNNKNCNDIHDSSDINSSENADLENEKSVKMFKKLLRYKINEHKSFNYKYKPIENDSVSDKISTNVIPHITLPLIINHDNDSEFNKEKSALFHTVMTLIPKRTENDNSEYSCTIYPNIADTISDIFLEFSLLMDNFIEPGDFIYNVIDQITLEYKNFYDIEYTRIGTCPGMFLKSIDLLNIQNKYRRCVYVERNIYKVIFNIPFCCSKIPNTSLTTTFNKAIRSFRCSGTQFKIKVKFQKFPNIKYEIKNVKFYVDTINMVNNLILSGTANKQFLAFHSDILKFSLLATENSMQESLHLITNKYEQCKINKIHIMFNISNDDRCINLYNIDNIQLYYKDINILNLPGDVILEQQSSLGHYTNDLLYIYDFNYGYLSMEYYHGFNLVLKWNGNHPAGTVHVFLEIITKGFLYIDSYCKFA